MYAYSNCKNSCANFVDGGNTFPKSETKFVKDVFTGVRWQCVEFSRRFLIITKQVTFEGIDGAHQIFNINTVEDLTKKNKVIPFLKFKNGNQNPPQVGDLVIYPITSDDM